ncbi:hypothetical protein KIL84_013942 [Mauremys mutica]|uniref:Uncharacterized protein n=1 Tax=Mauremys mutica TaxID=74926 RepID=A0A9D3WYC9_9SAUR|nr:hypothetical protein KIL84_013942 [Mauremys mutica]
MCQQKRRGEGLGIYYFTHKCFLLATKKEAVNTCLASDVTWQMSEKNVEYSDTMYVTYVIRRRRRRKERSSSMSTQHFGASLGPLSLSSSPSHHLKALSLQLFLER